MKRSSSSSSVSGRSCMADFELLGRLGSGAYGVVHKALRKADEKVYVIKSVSMADMSDKAQAEAVNEVALLAKMRSTYVVQYCDSFVERQSLHIVMEYCNRGDLKALLKKAKMKGSPALPERITWGVFLQVALGLYDLHRARVLHRDLKTANIFLTKNDDTQALEVKIGDLGVAKLLETTFAFAQTIVGTPYYLSPELCSDQPYGDKSDIWALGVVLYECCTLQMPFEATNQCALILKIIEGKYEPVRPIHVSPVLCKLVSWLLTREPMQRPSVSDILNERTIRTKLQEHGFELPSSLRANEVLYILQPVDRLSQEPPTRIVQRSLQAKPLPANYVPTSSSPPSLRKQFSDSSKFPDSKQVIRGTRVRSGQLGKRDVSSRALQRYQIQAPPPLPPLQRHGSKHNVRSSEQQDSLRDTMVFDGYDSDRTTSSQDSGSDCNSQADTITGVEQSNTVGSAPVALTWSVSDGSGQHIQPSAMPQPQRQDSTDSLEIDTTFEPSTLSEEEGAPETLDESYETFVKTLDAQELQHGDFESKHEPAAMFNSEFKTNSAEQEEAGGEYAQELALILASTQSNLEDKLGAEMYDRLHAVCKRFAEVDELDDNADSWSDAGLGDTRSEVALRPSEVDLLNEITAQCRSRVEAQETFQAMKRVLAFEAGMMAFRKDSLLRANFTA